MDHQKFRSREQDDRFDSYVMNDFYFRHYPSYSSKFCWKIRATYRFDLNKIENDFK